MLKYVCDIVVKKFTFAISSLDEFLCTYKIMIYSCWVAKKQRTTANLSGRRQSRRKITVEVSTCVIALPAVATFVVIQPTGRGSSPNNILRLFVLVNATLLLITAILITGRYAIPMTYTRHSTVHGIVRHRPSVDGAFLDVRFVNPIEFDLWSPDFIMTTMQLHSPFTASKIYNMNSNKPRRQLDNII